MLKDSDIGGRRHATVYTSAIAMGASDTQPLLCPDRAIVIESLGFIPDAAMTGHGTHTKIVAVQNRGSSGSGTTEVAPADTFGASDDLVAFDLRAFTLSTTAANLILTADQVLAMVVTEANNGIAWPAGQWRIGYRYYEQGAVAS